MPKPPDFYNRLEGEASGIVVSVLGGDGTLVWSGSYDFRAANFGNGVHSSPPKTVRKAVRFDSWGYDVAGTFELYWIPDYASGVDAGFPRIFDSLLNSGTKTRQLILRAPPNDEFAIQYPDSTGTIKWIAWTTPAWSQGDIFHIAWVWDNAGIDGSSDTQRFYINGSSVAKNAGTGNVNDALWATPESLSLYLGPITAANDGWSSTLDNFKIYDYAKTDFSSRFSERAGLNDQALIT